VPAEAHTFPFQSEASPPHPKAIIVGVARFKFFKMFLNRVQLQQQTEMITCHSLTDFCPSHLIVRKSLGGLKG
jgi:hypothetical protein